MSYAFIVVIMLLLNITVLRAQDKDLDMLRLEVTNELTEARSLDYHYGDVVKLSRNHIDSGITMLWQMTEHGKQVNDYDLLFHGYFGLGVSYSVKGAYRQGKACFDQALAYSMKSKHPLANTCRVLNNIGNAYLWQGDYPQAASYCFRAALLAERRININDRKLEDQLVRIYNNIAASLLYMHEYRKALYYLDKAEALANKLQHYTRLPSILNNKALVCTKSGTSEMAWEYYNRALALARKFRKYQEEYVTLHGMANYMTEHNQSEKAIPYLKAAIEIKGKVNPSYTSRTLSALGGIYLGAKDYTRAQHYLQQALEKGELAQALDCILQAHKQLALLYTQTGDHARAVTHMQTAYLLNDSMLNREKTEAVNRMEVKYRTAEKDRELAQKQLFIKGQQQKLDKKNTWIWISSLGILLLTSTSLFFFVLYRNNRHKQSLQAERIHGMEQEQEIQHLKAIMEGEEKERERIARELHDGIGGMLAAIKMNFSSLQQQCEPVLMGTGDKGNLERFAKIFDMLNETGGEIRETAHNLMPDILTRHGLTEALQLYCDKINTGNRLYLRLDIQGSPDRLPKVLHLAVYRIIQELMQNILKHAEATNALIRLTMQDADTLHILIRDNGKGFDPTATPGMGLHNIQSRVETLHGEVTVESSEEAGTTIYINIDIRNFKNKFRYEYSGSHSR